MKKVIMSLMILFLCSTVNAEWLLVPEIETDYSASPEQYAYSSISASTSSVSGYVSTSANTHANEAAFARAWAYITFNYYWIGPGPIPHGRFRVRIDSAYGDAYAYGGAYGLTGKSYATSGAWAEVSSDTIYTFMGANGTVSEGSSGSPSTTAYPDDNYINDWDITSLEEDSRSDAYVAVIGGTFSSIDYIDYYNAGDSSISFSVSFEISSDSVVIGWPWDYGCEAASGSEMSFGATWTIDITNWYPN